MIYRGYTLNLIARILILFIFLAFLAYSLISLQKYLAIGALILCLFSFLNLHKYLMRRFVEIDDFFEAAKYRDFSRRFVEDVGPADIRKLHKGFNEVNKVVREINVKKEVQYLYLQKILEMVDIGIIAYNLETGNVLWANDTIKETLDLPSFKNVHFVEKRKPLLFEEIFENHHVEATSVTIEVRKEKLKILISDTIFQMNAESFKIIVLQDIDHTLDRNENEAWKKLLSVMTHEIMNSIAPISSLAETLESQIIQTRKNPAHYPLELEDFHTGISSIKKRSEGLMKFAKTYRSLNKVTHLNLEIVKVNDLLKNIELLMQSSIKDKKVTLEFRQENPELQIEMDSYLIEQVLINLILNAVEACDNLENGKVMVSAGKNIEGNSVIRISDNGEGIPSEILETIFVPFFTTKKDGNGIGLSLCKQIMMLHSGKIQVNSQVASGTEVNLVF